MIQKTTTTYTGNLTRLVSVTIESYYTTEKDEKSIKLTSKLRKEFEDDFRILMLKYNLTDNLPF